MDVELMLQSANSAMFAHHGRRFSEVEATILVGSFQRNTYEQIAKTSGYAASYLKYDVGPKLWKLLGQAVGEAVSKTNFHVAIEQHWQQSMINAAQIQEMSPRIVETSALPTFAPLIAFPSHIAPVAIDWGEGVDVSNFYGRASELTTLKRWISQDRCRLVAVLGMGGIGKTILSAKLTHQLLMMQEQNEFTFMIWRSLRNAPLLETLLADLVAFLSCQQDTQTTIARFIHHCQNNRCLIILDNWETLLQSGQQAGRFRAGYEDYSELLKLIAESNHQSSIVLTSREKPAEIAIYEGDNLRVRSISLAGSPEAAQALLKTKELIGTENHRKLLCDHYNSNPLAIKIVATSIKDVFGGSIQQFLAEDTFLINGIRRLLDYQLQRLTELERSIMFWLAINREWTTIAELNTDIVPPISKNSLIESLESLSWRSLIEQQAGTYSLQSIVMEYVTEQLINEVTAEITIQETNLLVKYALIKATVKDYIRVSQIRLILQPIAERLQSIWPSSTDCQQQIKSILAKLRSPADSSNSDSPHTGYGAGNLLNLSLLLNTNLKDNDFSRLMIRHDDMPISHRSI
jgi:NACHT domain